MGATRDKMTFVPLLLLPLLVSVLGEMRCYFTTDKEQFTKIPDVLTCLCREQVEEEMFSWSSIVEMVESHLLPSILQVVISNCSSLFINLTDSQSPLNLLPNLTVRTSDHVYLDMVNDVATLPHYIHLVNVTEVHATIPGESVATGEDFYFILSIILGGLLVIFLLSLPLICWCVRRKTSHDEFNKKVSRAESWRYESSIYINPAPAARHHQMNLLPPASMNNTNTPLLNKIVTKPPLPDAVLGGYKSQSSPTSRRGGGSPSPGYKFGERPAYKDTDRYYHDDSDNSNDDQHSESGNYVDNHSAATLPHR